MKPVLPALAAVATLLAACVEHHPGELVTVQAYASDASAVEKTCFEAKDLGAHTVAGPTTLYVRIGPSQIYRLETTTACTQPGDTYKALQIRTHGGAGLVCQPLDLDIAIQRQGFSSPCVVRTIVRLTPSQAAALPHRLRP
jgi:hypothetical protein